MELLTGTPEQQAIWSHLLTGTQHAIVEAVAGSGKTTTLIQACMRLRDRRDLRIGLFAFNKHIADELNARMLSAGISNAMATTFNAFGMRQCGAWARRASGGMRLTLEQYKSYDIVETLLGGKKGTGYRELAAPVAKLVSLLKSSLLDPTPENIEDLVDKFDIDAENDVLKECARLAPLALDMAVAQAQSGVIDFDDQVYLPIKLGMRVDQFDLLMVDESQDLGPAQQELALLACQKGRIVVVGDSKQAIYRFRGADAGSMATMARRLESSPRGVKTFPLTLTRRCPSSHVTLAQAIVPQIQALPDAPAGEISCMTRDEARAKMQAGDLVISRTNRPLVQTAYFLLRRGVKAVIRGRDIGKGLIALLDKGAYAGDPRHLHNNAQDSLAAVMVEVDSYVVAEINKLAALGPKGEARMESLTDRYGCLKTLTDGCVTVAEVKSKIERIFADFTDEGKPNDAVILGTIHRTKGLEGPRVYVLESGDMPHPMARGSEQAVQELNLIYIACTRCKFDGGRVGSGKLVFVGPVPKPLASVAKALNILGAGEAEVLYKQEQKALARKRGKRQQGDTRPGIMIAMERLEGFGLGGADTYTHPHLKEETEEIDAQWDGGLLA